MLRGACPTVARQRWTWGRSILSRRGKDEATANLLKSEVSDGVIAPGFEGKALEILKRKKGGRYLVLEADPSYRAPV